MEFVVFFAVLTIDAVVLLWRSRRGTTSWRESPNADLRHDLESRSGGMGLRTMGW
jgi:hypothetical protein